MKKIIPVLLMPLTISGCFNGWKFNWLDSPQNIGTFFSEYLRDHDIKDLYSEYDKFRDNTSNIESKITDRNGKWSDLLNNPYPLELKESQTSVTSSNDLKKIYSKYRTTLDFEFFDDFPNDIKVDGYWGGTTKSEKNFNPVLINRPNMTDSVYNSSNVVLENLQMSYYPNTPNLDYSKVSKGDIVVDNNGEAVLMFHFYWSKNTEVISDYFFKTKDKTYYVRKNGAWAFIDLLEIHPDIKNHTINYLNIQKQIQNGQLVEVPENTLLNFYDHAANNASLNDIISKIGGLTPSETELESEFEKCESKINDIKEEFNIVKKQYFKSCIGNPISNGENYYASTPIINRNVDRYLYNVDSNIYIKYSHLL